MSIAIIRQRYNPFGGAERFVERALAGLRAEGVAVSVLTRKWQNDAGAVLLDPFYLGRTWRDMSFAKAVLAHIARRGYDLVQSHERIAGVDVFRAGDGVHATWLALRRRARGPWAGLAELTPWHRYTLAAETAMYRHPALRLVICNSEMVKRDIAARFALPTQRLAVVHNGVDLTAFHPGLRASWRRPLRQQLGIADQAMLAVFVGSGFERKGVFRLLPVMAQVRQPMHLLVVGADKAITQAKALARRLGLGERVHFLGGQNDVKPYLAAADVFCLPSLYDPMPNAALEAMATGLPVLTTPTSGAAELISHPEQGEVIDALDLDGWTNALERWTSHLAAGGDHYQEAARAAVEACAQSDMVRRLDGLYRGLLERR